MPPKDLASADPDSRFPADLVYRAAQLYYLEGATQADVATALGTSRPTVSRLLAHARASGVVHIEVREPGPPGQDGLAERLATALGLHRAWVTASTTGLPVGRVLAPAVGEALRAAELGQGDALLISSGATVYAVAQHDLARLPGVLVAPTVGGRDEPESFYQTNEITRQIAVRAEAAPVFLYAPAMPGPALHQSLLADASIRRVTMLWRTARCALLGIGAPPSTRSSLPFLLRSEGASVARAVGDICSRPFDTDGEPIVSPGSDRLVAMGLDDLRRVPHAIGVAVGADKVASIRAAARAGWVNELVTDRDTAQLLVDASATASGPSR